MSARSIRTRLLAGTALGVAATFVVSGVLVYLLTRSQLRAQFDDALATRAHALTALIEQEGGGIETELARDDDGKQYAELWSDTGKVLWRSRALGHRDLDRVLREHQGIALAEVTLPDGRAGKQATIVFVPHQDTEDGPAAAPSKLRFAVARDTDDIDGTIAALGRILALVGIAATLLGVGLMALAVRFGLRPVRDLARAIAELRATDLGARLDTARSPAELRPVIERLNDLLHRVEAAFARERELTAEVAHELRTPMAGLRLKLELALERERTPERYRTALADSLAICLHTQRIVEGVLSLARLDAGMMAVERSSVAVDGIVRDALATHDARASERGLTVTPELAPVELAADADKLRLVIDNLIDNAVSYADDGGTIAIVVRPRDGGAEIEVANTGCTLAPDDAANVFERFWRGDRARTQSADGRAHGGIGLALCKKLVELMGGTIEARIDGGRFVATVVLSGTSEDVDR